MLKQILFHTETYFISYIFCIFIIFKNLSHFYNFNIFLSYFSKKPFIFLSCDVALFLSFQVFIF